MKGEFLNLITLSVICESCREETFFTMCVYDRLNLYQKKGEHIDLRCKHCRHTGKYHVNDISAVHNRTLGFLNLGFLICGTAAALFLLRGRGFAGIIFLVTLPSIIYGAISRYENTRIRTFNEYRFKS